MSRIIKLTDEKAIEVISENTPINIAQKEVLAELQTIEERAKILEEDFNKNLAESQRVMEKARPLVMKFMETQELGEYEELVKVSQDEETMEWNIEIGDRMEEFKYEWEHRNDKKEEVKEEEIKEEE